MTLGTSTRGGIATFTGTEHNDDGHPLLRAAGRTGARHGWPGAQRRCISWALH